MKSEKTKEHIMQQTIALIEEFDGNTEQITIRKIAERAEIGVGLINHHFGSKNQLIEMCVQTIISKVVHSFQVDEHAGQTPKSITKYVVKQVMDFLMSHREISKISILGDMLSPKEKDNSMGTVLGLANCMAADKPNGKEIQQAFFLVAILQSSFLRKDTLPQTIGIDFYNKEQRDAYIDTIIDTVIEDEKS